MPDKKKISYSEAILFLRGQLEYFKVIEESYLGEDVLMEAERFATSSEFKETLKIAGPLNNATVLDLGAGNGIASYAFAVNGARELIALEPDDGSNVTGISVIQRITRGLGVKCLNGYAEAIPLPDRYVDIVYGRQVLHHLGDMEKAFAEVWRILKPGGKFIFVREPVADTNKDAEKFLEGHVMHKLAGNERVYSQEQYINSAVRAGLRIDGIIEHWDSVINAYPSVNSNQELAEYPAALLKKKLGGIGVFLSFIPFAVYCVRKRITRKVPGRLIAFHGTKGCAT